ncbi:ribonuclease III domain-containing protein [Spiroplasma sp. SV19]|uniref:ribonuclease III domain-containing protein n=1 Tax=Spiroplasma sp. SV19 TaxID=2570468 RepID=UPI0024B6449D|nr:ribonuclease III domain-containing protein [Spiroplasma sp. SV19]WHQ37355.1 hypothetical protein E7Y35_05745 [Spiroplasma sp. SV19]
MNWTFNKVKEFMEKLGIYISNESLWSNACTTKGCVNENNSLESYQKLEFLGDRIWNFCIALNLYNKTSKKEIKDIELEYKKLTNNKFQQKISKEYEFDNLLRMNKGEYNQKQYMGKPASDIIESIVGAMYIELGMSKTVEFINNLIKKYTN